MAAMLPSSVALVFFLRVRAAGPEEPSHDVFLARWARGPASRGELSEPEWWDGRGYSASGEPAAVFRGGQVEFSVHRDSSTGRFVQVQTLGFGGADIVVRTASAPEGPWSDPVPVNRPEEFLRPGVMVYAAKAHPWAPGAGLAVTYNTNALDFGELARDGSLYYPRFVRVALPGDAATRSGAPRSESGARP